MIGNYAFLLTTDEELPLIVELWNYFLDAYIYNNVTYENISFGGFFSPQTLIIGIFLGLAAACFVAVFSKKVNGVLVHKLIESGCTTPETAKSLPELDLADKLLLRFGVQRGSLLRSVIVCKEEEEHNAPKTEVGKTNAEQGSTPTETTTQKRSMKAFRVDPDMHHFYIPDEKRDAATAKFRQKGISWGAAALYAGIFIVALIILIVFLPYMLSLLDDFLGIFSA